MYKIQELVFSSKISSYRPVGGLSLGQTTIFIQLRSETVFLCLMLRKTISITYIKGQKHFYNHILVVNYNTGQLGIRPTLVT
jgi:hypothetical protein